MTTELAPRARRWLLVAAAMVAMGSAVWACTPGRAGRRGGLAPAQVQAFPDEVRESYELFAIRCSRCHTLSRPLSAQITEYEHWKIYVSRMRRHAGSGISEADADKILVFLRYYASRKAEDLRSAPGEPPDAPTAVPPPAGAPGSGGGGFSSAWEVVK